MLICIIKPLDRDAEGEGIHGAKCSSNAILTHIPPDEENCEDRESYVLIFRNACDRFHEIRSLSRGDWPGDRKRMAHSQASHVKTKENRNGKFECLGPLLVQVEADVVYDR